MSNRNSNTPSSKAILEVIVFGILILVALTLTACSNRSSQSSSTVSSSQAETTQPPVSESQSEASQEESSAPDNLADETVPVEFSAPIIGDMGIDHGEISFTIRIPKSWTVTDTGIFNAEEKIADLPNARPIVTYIGEDGQELGSFAETDFSFGGEDCIASGDFVAGEYAGKYYHRQYEDNGPHTDVIYCLAAGDIMIVIPFYFTEEAAVETQIEQFTALANTIEIV